MDTTPIPVLSALWLGILTSVNPCPLASNIAAVSFIMKRIDRTSTVLRRECCTRWAESQAIQGWAYW